MSAPNWGRTWRRLMRAVVELEKHGAEVKLPDQFEKPPAQRLAAGGIVKPTGRLSLVGESGPELVVKDDRQL